MKAQAVFLDRDGTIVRQIDGSYLSSINQIKLIETIYPVVALLQNEGYIIIIVTNQAGINKGIVTMEKSTDSKNTGYPTAVIKPALTKPIIPIVTILLSM